MRRQVNMVGWRHSKPSNSTINLVKIRGGQQLRAAKELSGVGKGGSINSLGDGEASIILQN